MYGKGSGSVVGGATVTGVGAVVLPHTGGNTLGVILAYSAIAIGVAAVVSQLVVRVLRRKYSAQ